MGKMPDNCGRARSVGRYLPTCDHEQEPLASFGVRRKPYINEHERHGLKLFQKHSLIYSFQEKKYALFKSWKCVIPQRQVRSTIPKGFNSFLSPIINVITWKKTIGNLTIFIAKNLYPPKGSAEHSPKIAQLIYLSKIIVICERKLKFSYWLGNRNEIFCKILYCLDRRKDGWTDGRMDSDFLLPSNFLKFKYCKNFSKRGHRLSSLRNK